MNENGYIYEKENDFLDKLDDRLRERHKQHLWELNQLTEQHYAGLDVPKDVALSICKDIRQSLSRMSCLGCMLLSEKDIPIRMKRSSAGYHGCPAVARRYTLNRLVSIS